MTLTRPAGACALVLSLIAAACGGGSNPNGPSAAPQPQIPNVTGNYTGTTVMVFPELGANARVTCPTTTTVTQAGAQVNIAPFVLKGDCGNISIPMGAATIDATGSIGGAGNIPYDDPSCGHYTAGASGGFFGRELRISISAVSATCYNFNMTITVTR